MNVDFSKVFNKQFEKLSQKRQQHARETIALFLKDELTLSLRNHALSGEWAGYRSISAGGDLRLHYKILNENTIVFVAVGTHSQLYK